MADFTLTVGVDVANSLEPMKQDINTLINSLSKDPPKIKVNLEMDNSAVNNFKEQIKDLRGLADELSKAFDGVNKASGRASKSSGASSSAQLEKDTKAYEAALKKVDTLLRRVTDEQNKWTKSRTGASSKDYKDLEEYSNALRELQKEIKETLAAGKGFDTNGINTSFANISKDVRTTENNIKNANEATKSWGDRIGSLSEKFATWFSITRVIMAAYRGVKEMANNTIALDTAMTELRKVTDETEATYNRFLTSATTRAKELGASLTDVVSASSDFARLGFNIEDAEKLADAALVYKNVGDGIEDIGDASESIISTMQAFGVEADNIMSVVDKFNEVGNSYAISSKGVGDALLRSASAMKAANNSLDETIALATAANTVVQDPDKVGTALKTLSMYLRAAKTEAEEAGESTEGMANSVSELRSELLSLTGNKVDIQLDENTFKSTYQIMKELSAVWGQLTDIIQANILELIGGKRNSNVVAAMLENFSVASNALETSANAAGSAMAENEKYLDSIEGRLQKLKATFQELSNTTISSGFLKGLVSTGTGLLTVIDKLISAFGGLGRTLLVLGGIIASANIGSIWSKLKNVSTYLEVFKKALTNTSLARGISIFRQMRAEGESLSTTFKALAGTVNGAAIAFTAAFAAIGVGIAIWQHHKQAVEEARNEAIEAANDASQSSSELIELTNKYFQLSEEVKTNAEVKGELSSTEDELLNKLDIEKSSLDELIEKYGNYENAIRGASAEKLKEQERDLRGGLTAKGDALIDTAKPSFLNQESMQSMEIPLIKNIEKNRKALDFVLSNSANARAVSGIGTAILSFEGFDLNSIEGIISAHEKLGKILDDVSEKVGTDNDVYKALYEQYNNCSSAIEDYRQGVDDLNNNLVSQQMLQEQINSTIGSTIPQSQEEFEKYRQSIIDAAVESKNFAGSAEDISRAVDNALSKDVVFATFVDNMRRTEGEASTLQNTLNRLKEDFAWSHMGSENFVSAEELRLDELKAKYEDAVNARERLYNVQRGNISINDKGYVGNVDINNRPVIVNNDGTYSTTSGAFQERWIGDEETGSYKIIHFTPILPDGTVLEGDALNNYIDSILSASDSLKADSPQNGGYGIVYKVDTEVNGEKITDENLDEAMGLADAWDVAMHELQDKMYNNEAQLKIKLTLAQDKSADEQIQEFNSWIDNLSESDKEIVYTISLAKETSGWTLEDWNRELENLRNNTDAFDTLREKANEAAQLAAPPISSWEQLGNVFDTYTSKMQSLAELQASISNGFLMSADSARKFAAVYPEILAGATATADGQVKLNSDVVNSFISGKEAELQGDIDAEIAKLEARKAALEAHKAFAEGQLELAKAAAEGEADMTKQEAEYRIQASNAMADILIQNNIDEATSYKLAAAAMAGNSQEFERIALEALTNLDGTFDQAAYNMALTMYDNMQRAQLDVDAFIQKCNEAAKAVQGISSGDSSAGAKGIMGGSGGGVKHGGLPTPGSQGNFEGVDFSFNRKELSLDDFIADLEIDISGYTSAIAEIDSQIGVLQSLRNKPLAQFNPDNSKGSGGSGGNSNPYKTQDDIEKAEEELKKAEDAERLTKLKNSINEVQAQIESLDKEVETNQQMLDMAGEHDYVTQFESYSNMLSLTIDKSAMLYDEFERLRGIMPQNSEEAQTLADRMESLGSDILSNAKDIQEYSSALEMLQVDAVKNQIKNLDSQISESEKVLEREKKALTEHTLTGRNGAFNTSFLIPSLDDDVVERKRKENEKILELEKWLQKEIYNVKKRYNDMSEAEAEQAAANAAAKAKESATETSSKAKDSSTSKTKTSSINTSASAQAQAVAPIASSVHQTGTFVLTDVTDYDSLVNNMKNILAVKISSMVAEFTNNEWKQIINSNPLEAFILDEESWSKLQDNINNMLASIGGNGGQQGLTVEGVTPSDVAQDSLNALTANMLNTEDDSWTAMSDSLRLYIQQTYGLMKADWEALCINYPLIAASLKLTGENSWAAREMQLNGTNGIIMTIMNNAATIVGNTILPAAKYDVASYQQLGRNMGKTVADSLKNVLGEVEIKVQTTPIVSSTTTSLPGNSSSNPQGIQTSGGGGALVATAQKYLGIPYVWGGSTPKGFDCSGLMQYVYAENGININRVADDQWHGAGLKITSMESLRPGDMVFFGESGSDYASHVGMYVGNGQMIHAPHTGTTIQYADIFNSNYYRGRFLGGKRLVAYASGTKGAVGGTALVGERGRELAILPNGQSVLLGKNGAEIVDIPKGTQIFPNEDTETVLKYTGDKIDGTRIPKYAKGTINVPSGYGSSHSYTAFDEDGYLGPKLGHWNTSSAAWKLFQELLATGELTVDQNGIYMYKGVRLVAVTSTVGTAGDLLKINQDDGTSYYGIVMDEKSQVQTWYDNNPANALGHDGGNDIIEFEVKKSAIAPGYSNSGVTPPYGNLNHNITSIDNLGNYASAIGNIGSTSLSAALEVNTGAVEDNTAATKSEEKTISDRIDELTKTPSSYSKEFLNSYMSYVDQRKTMLAVASEARKNKEFDEADAIEDSLLMRDIEETFAMQLNLYTESAKAYQEQYENLQALYYEAVEQGSDESVLSEIITAMSEVSAKIDEVSEKWQSAVEDMGESFSTIITRITSEFVEAITRAERNIANLEHMLNVTKSPDLRTNIYRSMDWERDKMIRNTKAIMDAAQQTAEYQRGERADYLNLNNGTLRDYAAREGQLVRSYYASNLESFGDYESWFNPNGTINTQKLTESIADFDDDLKQRATDFAKFLSVYKVVWANDAAQQFDDIVAQYGIDQVQSWFDGNGEITQAAWDMVENVEDEYFKNRLVSFLSYQSALKKIYYENQGDYLENIEEQYGIWQNIVDEASNALGNIRGLYSSLKDAAEEYSKTGFISVDSFGAIAEYGTEYMAFLRDENGQLVINKDTIEKVIAARTEQLGVTTALNYVEQLRLALESDNTAELEHLLNATKATAATTWDLVNANLEMLNLAPEQKLLAQQRIQDLRSLAAAASDGVLAGFDDKLLAYDEQKSAIEDILDLVMSLIQYEKDKEVEALNDQIDKYREIVSLKKESLAVAKEEDEHNKSVSEKVKEIAEIQSKINQLSLDDSREAQAEKKSLETDLANLQEELADYQADYAYDKTNEMLDKSLEAYEKEKNDEIEAVQESVSSTEKVYQLAIERLKGDWNTLYADILQWNYDAGSSIESDIVERWKLATDAVKEYGSYLEAYAHLENGTWNSNYTEFTHSSSSGSDGEFVIGNHTPVANSNSYSGSNINQLLTQLRGNATEWWTTTSANRRSALESENARLVTQAEQILGEHITPSNGTWYRENGEPLFEINKNEVARQIVSIMKQNSARWANAYDMEKLALEDENNKFANRLSELLGQRVTRDVDGVWWIGNSRLYDKYHSGGIVGRNSSLKDNEVMAVLEKGEVVLNDNKKDALYEYIDLSTYMLERFGKVFDNTGTLLSKLKSGSDFDNLLKDITNNAYNIKGQPASYNIETLEVSAPVQVVEKLDAEEIKRHSRMIGEISADFIHEGFTKRAIKATTGRF